MALPSPILSIPLDANAVDHWVSCARHMLIGAKPATVPLLSDTLNSFWHPDETILYIGRAGYRRAGLLAGSTISDRVAAYYGTRLGARRPHRGGYWLKTLAILHNLLVYWQPELDPSLLEQQLQQTFILNRNNSGAVDLPFANLRDENSRQNKQHGIRNPHF